MPTAAFIAAAGAANRQPVALLAIESPSAEKLTFSTQEQWADCTISGLNETRTPGEIQLQTDNAFYPNVGNYPQTPVTINAQSASLSQYTATAIDTDNPYQVYISGMIYRASTATTCTVYLERRKDGGSWQQIVVYHDTSSRLGAETFEYTDTLSAAGNYEYRLYYVLGRALNSSDFVKLVQYQTVLAVRYQAAGNATTPSTGLDFETTPAANCRFEIDDTIPTGATITVTGYGRNSTGASWTALGTITDGQSLSPYRYYQFQIGLTTDPSRFHTPAVSEIRLINGDSEYIYFSTHADTPVHGALPYIAPGGISSINSKIDLSQKSTIGELTIKLFWRPYLGELVASAALKNKTITCKIGFVGLAESDYEPYFVGTWYDYNADSMSGIITIKTRNIQRRYSAKTPAQYPNFLQLDSGSNYIPYTPAATYTYSGNIMDVMLDIADDVGIPDRLLNRTSFTDLAAGARSGTNWQVARVLSEPQDAQEMLLQLAISAGVFLFEGADGKLTAKLYDAMAIASPVATLDAQHIAFRAMEGGQKDLSTRIAVYYNLISGDGGSATNYSDCALHINATAETEWQETSTKEHFDLWNLSDTAITALAERWYSWYTTPRALVKAEEIPPRLWGIERGDVVAVRNLQLPCPATDWPGYSNDTRFLVMGKTISDPTTGNLTISLDLMQLEDATFSTTLIS